MVIAPLTGQIFSMSDQGSINMDAVSLMILLGNIPISMTDGSLVLVIHNSLELHLPCYPCQVDVDDIIHLHF